MASRTLEIIVNQTGNARAGIDDLNTSLDRTGKSAPVAAGGIKGVMGGLTSMVNPAALATAGIAAVGAALITSVEAAREGRAVQAQLAAVLESTGHAAGISQAELNKHAEALQNVTNFDDEAVGSAQALLLTFTRIGGEVMPRATKAVLDMSVAMGQDTKSSAVQLGKALNDPIKGITALTRVGVTFTDQQKEQIATMVKMGDVAGAQAVILAELEKEFGGSAEAAREADGGFIALGNSVGNLAEAVGELVLSANEGIGVISGLISVVDGATDNVNTLSAAFQAGLIPGLVQLFDNINPVTAALETFGIDIIPDFVASSEAASEALSTQAQAHANTTQAIDEQAAAASELTLTQMDALSELARLEEDYNQTKQDLLQKRLDAETDAAESQAGNYRTMQEQLNEIDLNRGKQTDEQIAAKKAKVISAYNEENAEIQNKLAERQTAIQKQLDEEKRLHEEKAAEIKRLMALQTLEQSGQLEELTGIAGITAQQYMDAVAAGAISANKEVETQAAMTEKTFEGAQKRTADIVKQNQALIARLHGETGTAITQASQRTTSAVVSDFERQAKAAYDANMAARGSTNYSSVKRNTNFGPGYAQGGSFIVPPGYQNDSFPMWVQSGERVTVETPGEVRRQRMGPKLASKSGIPAGWKLDETGLGYVPPDYVPGSTWNGSRWIPPAATVRGNYGQASQKTFTRYNAGQRTADLTRDALAFMASPQSQGATPISALATPTRTGTTPTPSAGGALSGAGGPVIHIDYHPAVSLADQRQLVDVLKQAVREINRLDKVVTA